MTLYSGDGCNGAYSNQQGRTTQHCICSLQDISLSHGSLQHSPRCNTICFWFGKRCLHHVWIPGFDILRTSTQFRFLLHIYIHTSLFHIYVCMLSIYIYIYLDIRIYTHTYNHIYVKYNIQDKCSLACRQCRGASMYASIVTLSWPGLTADRSQSRRRTRLAPCWL